MNMNNLAFINRVQRKKKVLYLIKIMMKIKVKITIKKIIRKKTIIIWIYNLKKFKLINQRKLIKQNNVKNQIRKKTQTNFNQNSFNY